jgi:hypothetical protein
VEAQNKQANAETAMRAVGKSTFVLRVFLAGIFID